MRYLCVLLTLLILFISPHLTRADVPARTQAAFRLEAAFVFNFLKFTQFPRDGVRRNYQLCVLSSALPLQQAAFKGLVGRRVRGVPIEVSIYAPDASFQECDVLFISGVNEEMTREIVRRLPQQGLLTVGEDSFFAASGGMIRFYQEGDKLRFEVNLEAAEGANLLLSSQLLTVARVIRN